METLINFVTSGISYILPFAVLMGTLVFLHEMGHFLVAKYFGVRVEAFSLGFGKTLLQFTRGDTTYKLSLIPLGGYVKMYGDDPNGDIPEDQKQYSFLHKPVSQRIWIVLAGPLMNLIIAVPIFALILILGYRAPANVVGDIKQTSEAHLIGFRSGDTITHIDDKKVNSWIDVDKAISKNYLKDVKFTLKRTSGEKKELNINIPRTANDKIFETSQFIGKIEGLSTLNKMPLVGVKIGSVAHESGLKSLDQVLEVNGYKISYWRELGPALEKNQNGPIQLLVKQFSQTEELPERSLTLKSNYPIGGQSFMESVGIEQTHNYILATVKDSPADQAGLKAGDKIVSINGKPITSWEDILNNIKSFKAEDKKLTLVVENSNPEYGRHEAASEIHLTPKMTEIMNRASLKEENRFTVGIYPEATFVPAAAVIVKSSNPIKALKYGVSETITWTKTIAISIYKLITNQLSSRNISGVITIGKVAGDSFKSGIDLFLKMMGLISINLFLLNLLPVPVLDGGHLVFFTIEAIKGSPLSVKKMQAAQQVGFVLLLSLMAFSFYNDIINLIDPIW